MASTVVKPVTYSRGDQASGKVVAITDMEIIVDLGTKAEGIINKRDLKSQDLVDLKVGDPISAFVVSPENEAGQLLLSPQKQMTGGKKVVEQFKRWKRFIQAQENTQFVGRVTEVNKGGLVVEVDGIRGFLPSSQISFKDMATRGGLEGLVGQELTLSVIEVDPASNRLIFSGRTQLSDDIKKKLSQFESGQEVSGKVAAILPLGLYIDLDGVEGVVYSQEISWQPTEDLNSLFEVGQEVKAKVVGKDENLGRLNLSVRKLSEDPFEKLVENFEVDDVVKGTVISKTAAGVSIQLKDNIEGFLPAAKIGQGTNYDIGQEVNFLVDNIDKSKRRINLAPFLTSTEGLLYR